MTPASTPLSPEPEEVLEVIPVLRLWVRGSLIGIALALSAVFAVAVWINPYGDDGSPQSMGTHRQMGLPPCTFLSSTGMPCPSCGMTTSFALLMHGDLVNSLRANAVGTMMAGFCILLVPWCVCSAVCQRTLFVRSIERPLTFTVLGFLGMMLLRWVIVLGLAWWNGTSFLG